MGYNSPRFARQRVKQQITRVAADVTKKAKVFGEKIRRKPNPKGVQASTRVILNVPLTAAFGSHRSAES